MRGPDFVAEYILDCGIPADLRRDGEFGKPTLSLFVHELLPRQEMISSNFGDRIAEARVEGDAHCLAELNCPCVTANPVEWALFGVAKQIADKLFERGQTSWHLMPYSREDYGSVSVKFTAPDAEGRVYVDTNGSEDGSEKASWHELSGGFPMAAIAFVNKHVMMMLAEKYGVKTEIL